MKAGQSAALKKATLEFLAELSSGSKESKRMSDVLSEFFRCAGGEKRFAQMMYSEFQKAHGIGLEEGELLTFRKSPKLILQWYELMARHIHKEDENRTLDISGVSQDDLMDALRALAVDLVNTNADFRRIAIESSIAAEPELVHLAMKTAGMSDAVDAEAVAEVKEFSLPETKEGDESFVDQE